MRDRQIYRNIYRMAFDLEDLAEECRFTDNQRKLRDAADYLRSINLIMEYDD